ALKHSTGQQELRGYPLRSAGRRAMFALGVAMLLVFAPAGTLLAQTTTSPDTAPATSSSGSGVAQDPGAVAADPSKLIDPDTTAVAMELRESTHFSSITVRPVSKSGNSKALIRAVLDDQSGQQDLHAAIHHNEQLMRTLKSHGLSVDDVVSITTDRNDNAIVFVRG
ncbi:hypothetical protein COL154_014335, partial [Colletotrichum chrysophilum]